MNARRVTYKILTLAIATVLFAGCGQSNVLEPTERKNLIVAAQPSDAANNPKSANDMFVSARFLAANSALITLDGDLARLNGTLLEDSTKDALLETSNIKDNTLWPVISNLAGYEASSSVAFSTPLGSFVFFNAVHSGSGQTYIVGIDLDTRKASILEAIGNGHSISTSRVLDAAALWAYRAIATVANYETGNGQKRSENITKEYQALAVGYLYAVESFVVESERRRLAALQVIDPESIAKNQPQDLVFSGESLRYAKGATEAELLAAIPALECIDFQGTRMCTVEASLMQPALLEGLPGTCMGGKEVLAELDEVNRLKSVGCAVAPPVAEAVFNDHQERFGDPKRETVFTAGMEAVYAEWGVGENYVLVTNYLGKDFHGKSLNNFNVKISTAASLPIRK